MFLKFLKNSCLSFCCILIIAFHLYLSYLLFTGNLIKEVKRENTVVFEGFVSHVGEATRRYREVAVITDGKEYINKELSNKIAERLIVGRENKIVDTKIYNNVTVFTEFLIYYFIIYMYFLYFLFLGYKTVFSSCFENKDRSTLLLVVCFNIFLSITCLCCLT